MNNEENPNGASPTNTSAPTATPTAEKPRKARGFAAMDPQLVSELAKRGGKAAHRAGTAHQFTSDEARIAGRKGGMATHAKRREKQPGTAH
jgi:general stress protein YciG